MPPPAWSPTLAFTPGLTSTAPSPLVGFTTIDTVGTHVASVASPQTVERGRQVLSSGCRGRNYKLLSGGGLNGTRLVEAGEESGSVLVRSRTQLSDFDDNTVSQVAEQFLQSS